MDLAPRNAYAIHLITGKEQKKLLNFLLENYCFTLLIVSAGFLHINLKGSAIQLTTKDVLIITRQRYSKVDTLNGQPEIGVISFDPLHFYGIPLENNAPAFLIFLLSLGDTKMTLKSEDFSMLVQWFRILHGRNAQHYYRYKTLFLEIRMLLQELRGIYFNTIPGLLAEHRHKHVITFRFLQHVERYFKTQHSVRFYANALHLSADYLSRAVKKVTRKTAKQCIEEKIMDTAKVLLLKKKGITKISACLGFKTTSHFCYFFKKHTSFSPSAFRRQNNGMM